MVYIIHDDKIEITEGQEYKYNKFLELLLAIIEEFQINIKQEFVKVHNLAFYSNAENSFKTTESCYGAPVCTFDYLVNFLLYDYKWRDLVTALFEYNGMHFGLFEYDYPFIQHNDKKMISKIIEKFEKTQILPELEYTCSTKTKKQIILR